MVLWGGSVAKFIENYNIENIHGADYNPRIIGDDEFRSLQESIKTLGILKPIIVRNDVIVAGHQRTKAMRSLGINESPCILLSSNTTIYDEIRFNQLHNGTDLDLDSIECSLDQKINIGFQYIDSQNVAADFRTKYATVRNDICRLIAKYGAWGSCISTLDGIVIHGKNYAMSAKLTRQPLLVYGISDDLVFECQKYLGLSYGQFYYGHLKKETYIQSLAQISRLRGESNRKSTLYAEKVIPAINKSMKGIDFGCGHGDYVKKLNGNGYDLIGVELFKRFGATNKFDLKSIHGSIDQMIKSLEQSKFDYVVCDSVLNSTDCLKAEDSIMAFLNFICKPDGLIFLSGRTLEGVKEWYRNDKATSNARRCEFLDKDGYSALYRKGHWFYQRFHDADQLRVLIERFYLEPIIFEYHKKGHAWHIVARKKQDLDFQLVEDAINYEFNLPLSKTITINRHDNVLKVAKQIK